MNNTPVLLTKINNIAIISINNPPVNALSHSVRTGLMECIESAEKDNAVEAIVISCEGRTFVAGADILEFSKPPLSPYLPEVINKVDGCIKPVVAALFGTVLGGGFELALSCHYRIASKGTKVGLPEVTLGLIPGSGGTQLLPRLVGIETAIEMITLGKLKKVEDINCSGPIDFIVDSSEEDTLLQKTLIFTRALITNKSGTRPTSKIKIIPTNVDENILHEWRKKIEKKKRGQIAPLLAIDAIENSIRLSFREAMEKERAMFIQCRDSAQSRAMRYAFFAEKTAMKYLAQSRIEINAINKVAVIGAGTMGGGIAMCFARAGIPVKILEMTKENLIRGTDAINKRFSQAVQKGLINKIQFKQYMNLITGTCEYQDLSGADLVVEAAFETIAVKREIFSKLDEVCKPSTILASNTSYLDINDIAKVTKRAEKVLGMHFFSPANIMKLVEVVKAERTSEETIASIKQLSKKIGKISVVVKVCYGFVGNRMYACYGREANTLLLEGATPEQIDKAMVSWGMAMGPLAVNDLSGIDIAYKARKDSLNQSDDNLYFHPANLMVESGRLGVKTGAGFYLYEAGSNRPIPDKNVSEIISLSAQQKNIPQRSVISDEEIQQRLILTLINEGAHILEEGIVESASDIDVIWMNGYGFPRYYGGPMCYANELGLDKVVEGIKKYQNIWGDKYWKPAQLLKRLSESGGDFT